MTHLERLEMLSNGRIPSEAFSGAWIAGERLREKDADAIRWAIERIKGLEQREAAVFATGFRKGHFRGTGGATAWQSEVDEAYEAWKATGAKTHLCVSVGHFTSKRMRGRSTIQLLSG